MGEIRVKAIYHGFELGDVDKLPAIMVVGLQSVQKGEPYDWNCRYRPANKSNRQVFQFTVSGEGEIEFDGTVRRLRAGQAFLVEKPGPFRYYMPGNSEGWEILFVELAHALPYWETLIERMGRVIEIDEESDAIKKLRQIFKMAENRAFVDTFHNSTQAYEFLMMLSRWSVRKALSSPMRDEVRRSLEFIKLNFDKPIGLADLVKRSQLSQSYFSRIFLAQVGATPIQHLTKLRLELAMQLLSQTNLPIHTVAVRCGFANGNYFAKVFRRILHLSPQQFRENSGLPHSGSVHFLQ